jgi:hypothetical protein
MMTLTQTAPSIHAEALAVLDPAEVRRAAIACIAVGNTPEILRGYARQWPGSCRVPWWLAAADEAEALTARGVTARHALRALDDREPEAPIRWTPAASAAREVAEIFATEATPDDVRGMARRAPSRSKAMFRAIADAMDELTAAAEALQPGNGRQ